VFALALIAFAVIVATIVFAAYDPGVSSTPGYSTRRQPARATQSGSPGLRDKESSGSRTERSSRARAVRARPAPRVHTDSTGTGSTPSRIVVRPQSQCLWQERGWTPRGNSLRGYYRTSIGAFPGRIYRYRSTSPSFYISELPPGIKQHEHRPCFQSRSGGEYFVHFSPNPRDPDTGIRQIEKILAEALADRRDH